ncbi:hypothetical protein [Sphingomonas sp. 8AM]|uniref:hypothetical protein n=1 Tax=Sphingomonas sp. 8AM TaxID=2653170 RepID=UPI0012F3F42A|nr:hypothetical protein [Sphingomonas sp. 8AM]VXC58075.1 conserved hypothetical protein [Sphingomonas sp. 8AM]
MSPRSEPGFRPPDEELSGRPAVLRFVLTLLTEMVIAAIAALIVLHYGGRERVDMIAALGIAFPIVLGGLSIVWLECSCHRRIGTSPFLLLAEIGI